MLRNQSRKCQLYCFKNSSASLGQNGQSGSDLDWTIKGMNGVWRWILEFGFIAMLFWDRWGKLGKTFN